MRRWSAALVAVIVLCILLLEHLGLEPDGYRTARAQAFVREHPEACLLEGRVTEAEYAGEEKCRITVDLGHEGKILLTVTGEGCPYYDLPGRSLRVRARCSLPEAASNPGAFDYRNHLRSEGICLLGRCSVTDLEPGRLSRDPFRGVFPNRASRFRYRLYHQLEALDPETAGILTGMLFGSKEHLEGGVYESFRENGTAHILCVSGLHVGVIYGGMCVLLGRRRRSRTGTLLVAGGLILYAFLASFSVSVTRAVWMIFLSLLAERIHRRYDMLSAAFVTAACLLVRQPALIYNSGFLLSFSAVIGTDVKAISLNSCSPVLRKQNIRTKSKGRCQCKLLNRKMSHVMLLP